MSAEASYGEDFPPRRHVSRDLGIAYRFTAGDRAQVRIPVTPHVVGADGAVRSEVLLSVFDEVSGFLAVFSTLPDWVATADFQFGVDPVPATDEVELRARLLKAGKRLVVIEAEAWTSGRRTAWAAAGFSRVPRSGANAEFDMPELDTTTVHDLAVEGSGLDRAYPEAVGIRMVEGATGTLELDFSQYVRNSAGILHGGVGGGLSLLSAEAASGGSPSWRAVDAHFHYLSPGRLGPFRTTATLLAATDERQTWRVGVVDAGDADRLMTMASVTTVPINREANDRG
jgi:acyl-coenzyme A thioesterase PaaI-like protein